MPSPWSRRQPLAGDDTVREADSVAVLQRVREVAIVLQGDPLLGYGINSRAQLVEEAINQEGPFR